MMLTLFIQFLVVRSVHSGATPKYELSLTSIKWNMTYKEAKDHCESLHRGKLPDDSVDITSLMAVMQQRQTTSIWMGIQMVNLGNWTWTDGERDTTLGPDQGTGGRVCAGVSTVSQNIQPKSCNYGSNLEGVVCQHKMDFELCPKNVRHWYCFELGPVVFSFKCGVYNWYDARFQCQTANASIAKLNTTEKIQEFVKTKNKIPSLSLCNFFWVGLRKEEWMAKHQIEVTGLRELESARWLPQQPFYGPPCVTFEIQSTSNGWKTTSCTDKHAVICRSSKQETTNTATANATFTAEDTEPVDSTPGRVGIYIGIGMTIGTGIIIACLVWCYCRKQHKKLKKQKLSKEGQALLQQKDHPHKTEKIDDHENNAVGDTPYHEAKQPGHIPMQEHGQNPLERESDEEKGDIPKKTHLEKAVEPDQISEKDFKHGPEEEEFNPEKDEEQEKQNRNTRTNMDGDPQNGKMNEETYQSTKHTDDWNKMVTLLQPLKSHWMKMAVISNPSYCHDLKEYLLKRQSPSLLEALLQIENGDQVNKYFKLLDMRYVMIKNTETFTPPLIDKHIDVIIITSLDKPNKYLYAQSPATGAIWDSAEDDSTGFGSVLNELQHAHILVAGEKLTILTDNLVIIRPAPVTYRHADTDADFYVRVPHQQNVTEVYQSAAYYTTVFIMMILRMARRNVSYPKLHKDLKKTRTMRQVLLDMCAPPGGPDEPRVLDPWRHLTSWDSFKAVTLK